MQQKLEKLCDYPSVWISENTTNLKRVVVACNFGRGDAVLDFFIPANTASSLDQIIRKRFNKELGHYTLWISDKCPFKV